VVHQAAGVEQGPPEFVEVFRLQAFQRRLSSVSTTQPGCVGQPAILTTGKPSGERKPAPSRPPGVCSSYCRPQASSGLPGVLAEKPP
jgi:hypothetical protein